MSNLFNMLSAWWNGALFSTFWLGLLWLPMKVFYQVMIESSLLLLVLVKLLELHSLIKKDSRHTMLKYFLFFLVSSWSLLTFPSKVSFYLSSSWNILLTMVKSKSKTLSQTTTMTSWTSNSLSMSTKELRPILKLWKIWKTKMEVFQSKSISFRGNLLWSKRRSITLANS